jgi:hypothetical protein
VKVFAVSLVWLVVASSAYAGTTRVAVVDVGADRTPSAFADLLTVALTKEPTIELVERERIARLLREQAISMALSGTNAVKAGKLVGADAFLMLEANTNRTLRIRLVDARYGLKLWDTMFSVGKGAEDFEERAQALAKGTAFRLANFLCGTDTPRTVSIAGFRSEEMSRRWDWLGEQLAVGVEQQLALQPGIVVMERARTRPLTEERELVEGLPEALRASAVIVDGAYRLAREKGTNAVLVILRCRHNNVRTLDTAVEGSLTDFPELQQQVVRAIAASLGKKADCGSMDTTIEAEMLAAEASSLLEQMNPRRALSLAEAAIALTPGESKYERLILRAYSFWSEPTPDEFLTDSIRGLQVMERLLLRDRKLTEEMYNFLERLSIVLSYPQFASTRAAFALPENRERLRDLQDLFWRVTEESREVINSRTTPSGLSRLLEQTSKAYRLSPSIEHAIKHSRRSLMEDIDLFKANPRYLETPLDELVQAYLDPAPATWPLDENAGKTLSAYLEELGQSEDVLIRMLAERAAMRLFGGYQYGPEMRTADYEKARRHAEDYARAVMEARGQYPNLFERYGSAFENARLADDPTSNGAFKGKMVAGLDSAFTVPPATEPPPSALQYQSRQLLKRDAALNLAPKKDGKPEDIHFRRLVIESNIVAIVYTHGLCFGERGGVLRLDPKTFQPVGYVASNAELLFQTAVGNVRDEYEKFGPAVAVIGRDIFVGFPMAGILWFQADGSVLALTEANGLATDNIRALDSLNGKLYAAVGRVERGGGDFVEESGLMEVDPNSHTSRLLSSSSAKFRRNILDGQQICGVASDNARHALWVLTSRGLYCYRHSNGSESERAAWVESIVMKLTGFLSLQRSGESLLVGGSFGCYKVSMGTERVEWLARNKPPTFLPYLPHVSSDSEKPRWSFAGCTFGAIPRRIVEFNHGIAFLDVNNWRAGCRNRCALLFRDGQSEPVELLSACFPAEVVAKLTLRDMAATKEGLLLLTDDALWLIPELRNEEQHP